MPRVNNLNELERKGKLIKGRWRLDDRHRLSYAAERNDSPRLGRRRTEEFELETSLVAAEPEALIISITAKQEDGIITTSIVKLNGKWRANENNQIEFEVERKSGKSDILTFTGSWKLNDSQQIIYSYQQRYLKQKTTTTETLTFKGHWDISKKNRLTYLLEGSSDESFRFRGTFQTPSIVAKKGEIRYQLAPAANRSRDSSPQLGRSWGQLGTEVESKLVRKGRGVKGTNRRTQTVTLFGKWKLSDELELIFEMEYGDKRKYEIRFGAEFELGDGYTLTAKLINPKGKSFGVEVILNKEFLDGNAQAFLRLRKSLEESAIEAGITIPW